MEKPKWKCAIWHEEGKGWRWDDAEDHGGYDRISPSELFPTRELAEADARDSFDMDVVFEDKKPDHY